MKIDKSLEEVWTWKEKIYQETKDMSMEERVKRIKENALRISQKYGLDLKIVDWTKHQKITL
jgi:hypothetical protein